LIYLNISKPGSFDSREGIVRTTEAIGKKIKVKKSVFPMLCNHIELSIFSNKDKDWPRLEELKIKETLEWIDNHWSAFNNIPKNRIQRAFNAFSYLFHDNLMDNSPSDLFFALIGIEALFVAGNESVQKQVDIKSQILLGERKSFKKQFNELYDFRSRFVHGQLNFINKYCLDDLDDDVNNHLFKSYEHSGFASLILIAAIQQHIKLNKTDLEFELKLKN
jgi:hypothetical protein